MAGGIAILLLIIVALVVGAIALALYGTGGFLWWRKTDPRADRAEHPTADPSEQSGDRRPQHTRPRTTGQERTDFVGRRAQHHG